MPRASSPRCATGCRRCARDRADRPDTGIWGTDFADEDVADGSPRNLAQLLRAVAEAVRPHNVWVRVLYLQPEGMTDELIETIRDTPEVLPYIDIPVQHCDARILKAMRRSGSRRSSRTCSAICVSVSPAS